MFHVIGVRWERTSFPRNIRRVGVREVFVEFAMSLEVKSVREPAHVLLDNQLVLLSLQIEREDVNSVLFPQVRLDRVVSAEDVTASTNSNL